MCSQNCFQKSFSDYRHEFESGNMKDFMKTTRSALAVMTLFAADTNVGIQERLD